MDKKIYLSIRNELNFTPSPARLRNHLLQDLGMIAAVAWLLAGKTIWGYAASQLLLACLYFRGFGMMHEAVHVAISKNQRVNNFLGILYGGLCFLPFTTWRSIHLDHHAWVGNFDKDPVMKMVREFPGKSDLQKKTDTYLWRSWLPYIAFLQETIFWTVSAKLIFEKDSYAGKRKELVASVAAPLLTGALLIGAGLTLGSWALLLPSIFIYLVMVEVVNLPHHLRLPRLSGEGKLSLWNQYKVSRTCIYSPWLSHFVLLNFNYHAEHHMFPTLPWYELPKAHEKVQASQPEGYQICAGYEWIRVNRQKDLREVFAPTEALTPETTSKPEAA